MRRTQVVLAALVLAGVVIRLLFVRSPGFPSDVSTFMAWAERLAAVGPARFYDPAIFSGGDYPPALLYVLWPIGALADGEALRLAVKALSIPFDVAIGVLLYFVARPAGPWRGPLAAGLYLLNPATVVAGPFFGQVDAAGTLPFLAALVAAGKRRWILAGVLGGAALMVKPQFGLAALAVGAAAAILAIRRRRWRALAQVVAAGLVTAAALALPFGLTPGGFVDMVRATAATYPYTSLYAFNPWGLALGFLRPDDGFVTIGAVLLAVGLGLSLVPLWWRRDLAALLAVATYGVFAFYFLPTRVHERYLFPVFATLAPLAAVRARLLVPYLALSTTFALSLVYMLTQNVGATGLTAPAVVQATLFSQAGVWVIGLILIGAAVMTVQRSLTGETSLSPTAAGAAPWVAAAGSVFRSLMRASDARVGLGLLALGVIAYLLAGRGQETPYDYFGRLAVAFTQGRYWLDDAPLHLNELVEGVGGHRYSVVPPLPALFLVPLVPFGSTGAIQSFLSAVAGGASGAPIYMALRRLDIPRPFALCVGLLSIFGTDLWYTAIDGRSWFAADAIGVLVLSLALWAAVSGRAPIVVGAALGVATLARAPMLLAAPALLLLSAGGPRIRPAMALVAGMLPFLGIEAMYNLARWGTPLEAGYGLLSGTDPLYSEGLFSLSYLPRHVYAILFEPPAFVDNEIAVLRARSVGLSLLVVTPALVWLARVPLVARAFPYAGALALGCLPLIPDMLFGTVGFEQYGYRRALDAQPFLMALLAIGAGWRDGRWLSRPSPLFATAVILSIVINLYFLVTIRAFGFANS